MNPGKHSYGYSETPYGSLGPGFCFPKSFIDKFSKLRIPEYVHDELRLPLYGQILGFLFKDTGFYRKGFDKNEYNCFNCIGHNKHKILITTIINELNKPRGRRVFHPYYISSSSMSKIRSALGPMTSPAINFTKIH